MIGCKQYKVQRMFLFASSTLAMTFVMDWFITFGTNTSGSNSGLIRRPFKAEITGSNPVPDTTCGYSSIGQSATLPRWKLWVQIPLPTQTASLYNGSTQVFGACCGGSNPSGATNVKGDQLGPLAKGKGNIAQ